MKASVKFRIKNGIPFSIETISGKQYRCGICGKIFFVRDELELHLQKEDIKDFKDYKFPELYRNISINVVYVQDVRDTTNSKYPRLQKGDKLLKRDDDFNK